ncbi:MAG: hypothetical protein LAT67_08095 [Balneolales bacterium]|nr:hypothetical protein [Balneolales bacterium]
MIEPLVIAIMEVESVWLIIGFFIFVSVMSVTAIYVLLRSNGFRYPADFAQAAMLVLLAVTFFVSIALAIGLFSISTELRMQ